MKLIYRGESYDYNPNRVGNIGRPARAPHIAQTPYTVIYRGQTLQIDPSNTVEVERPQSYELIYRGETYQMNRSGQVSSAPKAEIQIPDTMPRHFVGKVHQANLEENLQRRLKVAKERGDRKLIEMLEAERQQIAV
jgi:Domain of unknown function (DUF4278)